MDRTAFKKEVLARSVFLGRPLGQVEAFLKKWLLQHDQRADFQRKDVSNVIELLGAVPASEVGEGPRREVGVDSRGALIASARLRRAIEPWVEEVREEMEGLSGRKVSLPFSDHAEAVRWIRQEPPGDMPEEATQDGVRSLKQPTLLFRDPGLNEKLKVGAVQAGAGSSRRVLKVAANRMAQATGFEELDLVDYILAGIEPLPRPVVVETKRHRTMLRTGGVIRRTEVTVTYRTPEVSFKNEREIHRAVRAEWEVERKKSMTALNQAVLEIVEGLGPVPGPGEGKPAFFNKVRQELEKRGIMAYTDWNGAYQAYKRAEKKMRPLDQ
jgi:hypothetical protein